MQRSPSLNEPSGATQSLHGCRYGVTHTLDQVFKAPTLIKHVLAAEANINETYICEKWVASSRSPAAHHGAPCDGHVNPHACVHAHAW